MESFKETGSPDLKDLIELKLETKTLKDFKDFKDSKDLKDLKDLKEFK